MTDRTRASTERGRCLGSTARVHWLDDALLGVEMFAVTGRDRAAVAKNIRAQVPTYTTPDLIRLVGADPIGDHLAAVLPTVGAAAPTEADATLLLWIRQGLQHSDVYVRSRAVLASAATRWPELHADVQTIAESDVDADLRRLAESCLPALKEVP